MSSDAKVYCQYMEEIKERISIIRGFLDSSSSFGSELYDYEIVCIHLRKILELIVFSTLAANKEEYSRAHKDFAQKWNAKRLLSSIGKINPNFYPKPVKFGSIDARGVKHLENVKSGFLHKDEWEKLYNLCSKVLHVWNPYVKTKRHLNFEKSIIEWVQCIQNLLDMHYVQLFQDKGVWVVTMVHPEDGKVHAMPSEPVESME
jgi:hypothetical protein